MGTAILESSTFKFDNHYGCYCSYVDADCFPQEQSCRDKLQLYIPSGRKEHSPALYINKTAMQRGKPLNDIPKRKNTAHRCCVFSLPYSVSCFVIFFILFYPID